MLTAEDGLKTANFVTTDIIVSQTQPEPTLQKGVSELVKAILAC